MKYHRYRFGFKKNIKVFICRRFGHRLNENPAHHWCERCGLAYEECYHPKNYWAESGIVGDISAKKEIEQLNKG